MSDNEKIQAAIEAAMNAPLQKPARKPAEPVPTVDEPVSDPAAGHQDQPATQESAPVAAEEAVVVDGEEAPERDWSEVDRMLEEGFEERQKKRKVRTVFTNVFFYGAAAAVVGSATFWYVGSEANQAKVASLVTDLKTGLKQSNPAAIKKSYDEALGEIAAHQKLIESMGEGIGAGQSKVETPAEGTARNDAPPTAQDAWSAIDQITRPKAPEAEGSY